MSVTIHLYGLYRKKFGSVIELHVQTFAAAIRLLEANYPGKFVKMVESDAFHICKGKTLGKHINIEDAELLKMQMGNDAHYHLIPAAVGAANSMKKKGLGAILLGALVLGASFFFGFTPGIYAGLSLILGGASLLLTPDMSSKSGEDEKNKSYTFSGPTNVSTQGSVVPVVYGRARVGSVVAAGSISTVNRRDK